MRGSFNVNLLELVPTLARLDIASDLDSEVVGIRKIEPFGVAEAAELERVAGVAGVDGYGCTAAVDSGGDLTGALAAETAADRDQLRQARNLNLLGEGGGCQACEDGES